jgi:hypothetical protein
MLDRIKMLWPFVLRSTHDRTVGKVIDLWGDVWSEAHSARRHAEARADHNAGTVVALRNELTVADERAGILEAQLEAVTAQRDRAAELGKEVADAAAEAQELCRIAIAEADELRSQLVEAKAERDAAVGWAAEADQDRGRLSNRVLAYKRSVLKAADAIIH